MCSNSFAFHVIMDTLALANVSMVYIRDKVEVSYGKKLCGL